MSCAFVATLILITTPQDDIDGQLERAASRLSTTGPTSKLMALMKSDAGRLVLKERINALATRFSDRFDRDTPTWYERAIFTEDAAGNLTLRPERRPELDRLIREVRRRTEAFAAFDRQAQDVAHHIAEDKEIDKRARQFWSTPSFRLGLFQLLDSGQRDADPEELFTRIIGRALHRGSDGKLHVRGMYKGDAVNAINDIRTEAEGLAPHSKTVAGIAWDAEVRKLAVSPAGQALLARRLGALANEGAEEPLARVQGEELERMPNGAWRPNAALLAEIAALAGLHNDLKPIFARTAAALAEGEGTLRHLLTDDLGSALATRTLGEEATNRRANRDTAITGLRDDHFSADEKGVLTIRSTRFVNDAGADSVDALHTEYTGVVDGYKGMRETFDQISDRVTDPLLLELYATEAGASALNEHLEQVIEQLKIDVWDSAVERFLGSMLVKQGDRLVIRPERVAQVEAMAQRAEEVSKSLEAASREK